MCAGYDTSTRLALHSPNIMVPLPQPTNSGVADVSRLAHVSERRCIVLSSDCVNPPRSRGYKVTGTLSGTLRIDPLPRERVELEQERLPGLDAQL